MNFKASCAAVAVGAALLFASPVTAKELRLATGAPENTPWGDATMAFAATLAELSDGALTVKPFLNGSLGSEQDTIRQVARGRIDMGGFSATAMALMAPDANILAQQYIWDNPEQRWCFEDEHYDAVFGPLLAEAGLKMVGTSEVGHEIIYSKEPTRTPADLEGRKIRIPPQASAVKYFETTGGSVVPSGIGEIIPNFKTGAIDTASTSLVFGISVGIPEVAPNITVTNHVSSAGTFLISKRVWDRMNAQEQGWLVEAAQVFESLRPQMTQIEGALLSRVEQAGGTVIRPSADELAQWRQIAIDNREETVAAISDNAPDIWAQVVAARTACQK